MLFGAAVPSSAADVTLIGPDGRAALSEAEQGEVADIVKREAKSCSLSSDSYPDIFRDRDPAAEWQKVEGGPHLYVRFDTAVVMGRGRRGGGPMRASEALVGLDNPKFPHQPLTRHEGVVTIHGKCDGGTGIELMCQPTLRPYFEPKVLENNCAILERMRQR